MSATVHHMPGTPCPDRLGRNEHGRVTVNRCKGHPTEPTAPQGATGHPAGTGGTTPTPTPGVRRAVAYLSAVDRLHAHPTPDPLAAHAAELLAAVATLVAPPPGTDRAAAFPAIIKAADNTAVHVLNHDHPTH